MTVARPLGAWAQTATEWTVGVGDLSLANEKSSANARIVARVPVIGESAARPVIRAKRGDRWLIRLKNQLETDLMPELRGFRQSAALEPFLAQTPLRPGETRDLALEMTDAGTGLIRLCPLAGSAAPINRPTPHLLTPLPAALITAEPGPPVSDTDETLVIEEWRLDGDGSTAMPGQAMPGQARPEQPATSAPSVYTVNGRSSPDIPVRPNSRLRLRLINACLRRPVAIAMPAAAFYVIAIDGQPAEPFPARNNRVVLAAGNRIDALLDIGEGTIPAGGSLPVSLIDGTATHTIARLVLAEGGALRPNLPPPPITLPGNGLPERLDLANALRPELDWGPRTGTRPSNWRPLSPAISGDPPAFRAKQGRTAVCTLKNTTAAAVTFHVHGHPFRLLDRLDDGWKPFWLDTLLVDAGRTERIAFAAGAPGRWLIEAVPTDWDGEALARWFAVER
jgi:FtsP/CotA-like multicopper oxidase with cupredoxin domain